MDSPRKNQQKQLVLQYINEKYIENNNKGTNAITKVEYEQVVKGLKALRKGKVIDEKLKRRIQNRGFKLQEKDGKPILVKKTSKGSLPVIPVEECFEKIYQTHSIHGGHCGIGKTDDLLKSRFCGIPRCVIQYFINVCPVCNLKKNQVRIDNYYFLYKICKFDYYCLRLTGHRVKQ